LLQQKIIKGSNYRDDGFLTRSIGRYRLLNEHDVLLSTNNRTNFQKPVHANCKFLMWNKTHIFLSILCRSLGWT